MTLWGIVVAAGTGSRFGGSKHDALLDGRPLWEWARNSLLEAGADGVTLVGPVPDGVQGGTRRQDSVANGLAAVPDDVDVVAVHDAARPLASPEMIGRLLERVADPEVQGVVPVMPLPDTIKQVDGERVGATLDRSEIVAVQTPQVFDAEWLRRAHREVGSDATDDAAMVEAIGGVVVTVPGEAAALKITVPADLALAEHYLGQRDTHGR